MFLGQQSNCKTAWRRDLVGHQKKNYPTSIWLWRIYPEITIRCTIKQKKNHWLSFALRYPDHIRDDGKINGLWKKSVLYIFMTDFVNLYFYCFNIQTISEVCLDVPEFSKFMTFILYLHPDHLSDHMVNYGPDTLNMLYPTKSCRVGQSASLSVCPSVHLLVCNKFLSFYWKE